MGGLDREVETEVEGIVGEIEGRGGEDGFVEVKRFFVLFLFFFRFSTSCVRGGEQRRRDFFWFFLSRPFCCNGKVCMSNVTLG